MLRRQISADDLCTYIGRGMIQMNSIPTILPNQAPPEGHGFWFLDRTLIVLYLFSTKALFILPWEATQLGDSESNGTRYTTLEDCRYPSYLSIRTAIFGSKSSALIGERTMNPSRNQQFRKLSHPTKVILYKNDCSF